MGHGRVVPQRPKEGWSYVVHTMGRKGAAKEAAYVVQPEGHHRPLNKMELVFQKRTTPRRRRRYYY